MDQALALILAAAVTATPPTVMAALAWRKGQENAQNIGQSNGRGPLTDMGGALLTAFETHAELDTERFDRLEKNDKNMQAAHERLEAKLDRAIGTNRPPNEGETP